MSNTIPPLLNNSPPPIIGPLDDFENDEFGDFNSARDSSFDLDVLSFPYNSPQISSHIIDHGSNKISIPKKADLKGSLHEEHQCSDLQPDTKTQKQVLNEEDLFEQNHSQNTNEPTDYAENAIKFERGGCTLENNISNTNEFINTEYSDLDKNNTNINEIKKVDINDKESNHDRKDSEISQLQSEIDEISDEENKCISDSCKFKEDNCNIQCSNETLESTNLSTSINNSSQEDKCTSNSQTVENINFEKIELSHIEIFQENERSCSSNEIITESVPNQQVEIISNSKTITNQEEEHKEIGNYDNFESFDEKENKFEAFADFNDHITSSSDVLKDEQDKQDDDFDDFADFSSASNLSATTDPEVETPMSITFPKLEEIETTIKEFFPLEQEQQNIVDYFPEYNEKDDIILTQIRDITDTKALVYKWAKSSSQGSLYKALNIDMRNILYGRRWNETMPPFAATLGFVPLEPVKSDSSAHQGQESSINVPPIDQIAEKETVDVPSAQFDWNLAGLTNPLDYSNVSSILLDFDQFSSTLSHSLTYNSYKFNSSIFNDDFKDWMSLPASQSSSSLKGLKLSNTTFGDVMPSKISDDTSVKSLNFNEITTDYDSLGQNNKSVTHLEEDEFGDFEGFTSDQYSANENIKEIPLRETYISNQIPILSESVKSSPVQVDNDSQFSSWIEVNKLESLPNLRLETPHNTEDDFDDFQTSSPPKQEIRSVPSPHQFLASEHEIPTISKDVPPTSSTLPLEPIIPVQVTSNYTCLTPLQPIPASSNVQTPPKIEWPEPGISGHDLDDIELSYKPKIVLEKEEQQDNKNKKKQPVVIASSRKEKKTETEEDDWSDFVSSENASSNSESSKTSQMFGLPGKPKAELQLSISQLNQIQPPKKPTPVITHQGLYMSGGYQTPSSIAMQITPVPPQTRSLRQTFPNSRPTNTDFQPSLISSQYAKQVETLNFGHHHNIYNSGIGLQQQTFASIAPTTPQKMERGVNDDEEWSDFVSSQPVVSSGAPPSTNGCSLRDIRMPNWPATNITPNIITNPVAFDSFHNYSTVGTKSKGGGNGTIGGVNASPFVPDVASSVPELDFVVPKSKTWKK